MATADSTVEYRDIPGFPGYRVGSDGSVWYAWANGSTGRHLTGRWKPMRLRKNAQGYWYVNLTPPQGGKYKSFRVHRLVLLAFVGPCPPAMECRHLNGVRDDCRLVNLAWGTKAENAKDRTLHGHHGTKARLFTLHGQTMPLKHWAREFGIPYLCLYQRVSKLGMTFEEAIARPYRGTASNGGHWKGRIKGRAG